MFTYHSEGQFHFRFILYLYIINIILNVERDKISCGLQPTRFFLNFYKTILLSKKAKFQIYF